MSRIFLTIFPATVYNKENLFMLLANCIVKTDRQGGLHKERQDHVVLPHRRNGRARQSRRYRNDDRLSRRLIKNKTNYKYIEHFKRGNKYEMQSLRCRKR